MDEGKLIGYCIVVGIISCFLCWGVSYVYLARSSAETFEGVVVESYASPDDDAGVLLAVIRDDNGKEEIFENEDSIPFLKFNSEKVQDQLNKAEETGERCTFLVYEGWRLPFTSKLRNIVKLENCSPPLEG